MFKLNKQTRDEIVKIIASSQLPTNQGLSIIQVLNGLEEIKEEVKK
jgi:hypothetical protein